MTECRPLAILVFNGVGDLLRGSPEVAELTGHPAVPGEPLGVWCGRMFLDTTVLRLVEGALGTGREGRAGGMVAVEFSAPFRTAEGQVRGGRFILQPLARHPGSESPQAMLAFFEQEDLLRDLPALGLHQAPPVTLGWAVGRIQAMGRELLALVERTQAQVVASARRIRQGQGGGPELWDELLREAFALEQIRAQVRALMDAGDAAHDAPVA